MKVYVLISSPTIDDHAQTIEDIFDSREKAESALSAIKPTPVYDYEVREYEVK